MIILIDGFSVAFRAFYALPESLMTSDGTPTNLIHGFLSMINKVIILGRVGSDPEVKVSAREEKFAGKRAWPLTKNFTRHSVPWWSAMVVVLVVVVTHNLVNRSVREPS